jgi:hypothetical protein
MKIITVDIPEEYLRLLEERDGRIRFSWSQELQEAIRTQLINELRLGEKREKDTEEKKITKFFDYCINCESKLHNIARRNHFFYKNIEVFELKFCCSCYKQFKDKSFDEFPVSLIDKIRKKIKAYKNIGSTEFSLKGKS